MEKKIENFTTNMNAGQEITEVYFPDHCYANFYVKLSSDEDETLFSFIRWHFTQINQILFQNDDQAATNVINSIKDPDFEYFRIEPIVRADGSPIDPNTIPPTNLKYNYESEDPNSIPGWTWVLFSVIQFNGGGIPTLDLILHPNSYCTFVFSSSSLVGHIISTEKYAFSLSVSHVNTSDILANLKAFIKFKIINITGDGSSNINSSNMNFNKWENIDYYYICHHAILQFYY